MKQHVDKTRTLALSFYRQGMMNTYAALMRAVEKMERANN